MSSDGFPIRSGTFVPLEPGKIPGSAIVALLLLREVRIQSSFGSLRKDLHKLREKVRCISDAFGQVWTACGEVEQNPFLSW